MDAPELVLMGRASGAFGLKGELKVYSFAEDADSFVRAGVFYLGPNRETVKPYTLVSLRPHGGRLLISAKEIKTREDAEQLKGAWVFLSRDSLPPTDADEYYWFEIIGASVRTSQGRNIGLIEDVADAGAHELWMIRSPEGREAIIPAIEGVVLEMDLKKKVVVIEPPQGLFEAQGWPSEE